MDLLTFFSQSAHVCDPANAAHFATAWTSRFVPKGQCLARQDEPEIREFILLDGRAVATILDSEGRAVCVGLYVAPCVIPPLLARSNARGSLVTIEAKTDALIAELDSDTLTEWMLEDEPIRTWANDVLRQELARKADREWGLAALGGADRLAWFRDTYPGYDQMFSHTLIASFLGVTPVTFSRLRRDIKAS